MSALSKSLVFEGSLSETPSRIDLVTFGCRLNTYESEVMRREAETAGLGKLEGGAVIFNTCAVTGEAVRQARQAIRKARRDNPQARIIVTGCAAQTEPEKFAAMDEVDLVLGNEEKLKAHSYRALPDFGANATESRLMPHLHLSLQSGDDMILKRMKRRHSRDQSIRFCEDVRKLRPGIVFGADIIAGFPTETDEMFENSEKIVEECGLTHLHVFPFSPREGTPAARMPQLRREVVKQRAARLRAAGEAAYRRHLSSL